ncbi:putative molybdenum cofactor sulfurtransferase [Helianthus anomalus]
MHISLRGVCLICNKKNRTKHGSSRSTEEIKTNASQVRKSHEIKIKAAIQQASEYGSLVDPQSMDVSDTTDIESTGLERSRSLARLEAQKEFLIATSLAANTTFETADSIHDLDEAFSKFLTMYPKYKSTEKIDELRVTEYAHLADKDSKVCLDYCGFGLFSFLQVVQYWESCSISLSQISANLRIHALYGALDTSKVEHDIKDRIMDYLKLPKNEYGLVFTVSRGSAFKLLAESYPFSTSKNLLTMFDHESQSVDWMAQTAKQKGAKVHSAWFKWPTLKPCSTHLRKQILNKKKCKKDSSKGLFVFPVQSRVTGAKYSYQWMSFAQQNNWHVLLDAGALGPLDMDSLGLSLFRPDFIITSFYRVFRYDPTGFGCLLIKKTAIKILQKQASHTSSGMVKIDSVFPRQLRDSMGRFSQLSGTVENEDEDEDKEKDEVIPEAHTGIQLPAFSGALNPSLVRDVYESETEHDDSPNLEETETEMFSVMKSPVLTRTESPEDTMWIDVGQSPLDSHPVIATTSLPPPFWFTRNRHNNKFDSQPCENDNIIKTQEPSPEIQEEPEIQSYVVPRETEDDFSLTDFEDQDDYISDEESENLEPEITCRHLDHVNMLGLSKTTSRLRFLINWLVTSMLQLRLPGSNPEDSVQLVHIYGPKIKYERGASLAFNVRDRITGLISPEIVQKMGEANGICLGIGILSHVKIIQNTKESHRAMDLAVCRPMDDKNHRLEGLVRAEVVTASLGFLTNFEDVYRLWAFVAKFLDPSFVREYGLSTLMEGEEL